MKKMGIWIDHRKAIMVSLDGEQFDVQEVLSEAENHYRPSGGWKSSGSSVAQSVVKEQTADERRNHQFHAYYQNIMNMMDNVGQVYIFGPAEAKTELKKEMDLVKVPHMEVAAVEACDKLTEHEIVKKVKSFFHVAS